MKHEIDIPDFPDGWEAVSFRVPEECEYYFGRHGIDQATDDWPDRPSAIIVRKKQPRRIVLEETEVCEYPTKGDWYFYRGELRKWNQYNTCDHQHKLWKIVEDSKCAE